MPSGGDGGGAGGVQEHGARARTVGPALGALHGMGVQLGVALDEWGQDGPIQSISC